MPCFPIHMLLEVKLEIGAIQDFAASASDSNATFMIIMVYCAEQVSGQTFPSQGAKTFSFKFAPSSVFSSFW